MYSGSVALTGTGSAGAAWAIASSQSRSRPGINDAFSIGALEDDAALGLVGREFDGRIEHGLVLYDPVRLDAARGRDDDVGFASLIRVASSWAAKPPKTTEWTAPSRAEASMATSAWGSSASR